MMQAKKETFDQKRKKIKDKLELLKKILNRIEKERTKNGRKTQKKKT